MSSFPFHSILLLSTLRRLPLYKTRDQSELIHIYTSFLTNFVQHGFLIKPSQWVSNDAVTKLQTVDAHAVFDISPIHPLDRRIPIYLQLKTRYLLSALLVYL